MYNTYDDLFNQAQQINLKITVICGVNYAMTGRVSGFNDKLCCLVLDDQTQVYLDRTKILFAFFSPQQTAQQQPQPSPQPDPGPQPDNSSTDSTPAPSTDSGTTDAQ